jgi:hypothetical protein
MEKNHMSKIWCCCFFKREDGENIRKGGRGKDKENKT